MARIFEKSRISTEVCMHLTMGCIWHPIISLLKDQSDPPVQKEKHHLWNRKSPKCHCNFNNTTLPRLRCQAYPCSAWALQTILGL